MNIFKLAPAIIKMSLMASLMCGHAWANGDLSTDDSLEENDLPQDSIDLTLIIRYAMPEDLWPKHITKINCTRVDQNHSKCNVRLDFDNQKVSSLIHLKWVSIVGWRVCRKIDCVQ